jgi:SAM-dependent methyltransferase
VSERAVDYDIIAPTYDRRYARNRFDGVLATLREFIGRDSAMDVVEVGCGTGHWLGELAGVARARIGVDASTGMLSRAREAVPDAMLVRGRAERLPLRNACVDRAFCINALHHFTDPHAFAREARRILRPGGGLMTIGLDPHTGEDRWWIYDYFPAALEADKRRYASKEALDAMFRGAGFASVSTRVAHHIPGERSYWQARELGVLDRRSTSQLMVISEADYERGIARMDRDQPVLRADLRLYATTAWW